MQDLTSYYEGNRKPWEHFVQSSSVVTSIFKGSLVDLLRIDFGSETSRVESGRTVGKLLQQYRW